MTKAMLFCAGLGTRLKPFTLNAPKALVPVNGKPILQRNLEYLASYGIKEVVVNVHHFAHQIVAFLQQHDFGIRTMISDETDEVLETGGGLLKARPLLDDVDDFLVMNVDILTDLDLAAMLKIHLNQGALATLAVSNRVSSRGLLINEAGQLCGWHNKKTGEEKIVRPGEMLRDVAFSGIQLLNKNIFPLIRRRGKFSIIDVYLDLASSQHITTYNHSGCVLMDVGKPESVTAAEKIFK